MAKGKYHDWITEEGLLLLEGWARDGLTDEQIAAKMGIVTSTLYDWKKRFSEISETLKRGKEIVDRQVEKGRMGVPVPEVVRKAVDALRNTKGDDKS